MVFFRRGVWGAPHIDFDGCALRDHPRGRVITLPPSCRFSWYLYPPIRQRPLRQCVEPSCPGRTAASSATCPPVRLRASPSDDNIEHRVCRPLGTVGRPAFAVTMDSPRRLRELNCCSRHIGRQRSAARADDRLHIVAWLREGIAGGPPNPVDNPVAHNHVCRARRQFVPSP